MSARLSEIASLLRGSDMVELSPCGTRVRMRALDDLPSAAAANRHDDQGSFGALIDLGVVEDTGLQGAAAGCPPFSSFGAVPVTAASAPLPLPLDLGIGGAMPGLGHIPAVPLPSRGPAAASPATAAARKVGRFAPVPVPPLWRA